MGQLEQVFVNLTLNARDAMPEGGRLTISTRNVSLREREVSDLRPGRYVQCAVSDTGSGMSEEVRAHIFEPFFTTKDKHGTGLGLASVHGIVHQSRGEITVESREREGTTFRIWLPVTEHRAHVGESRSQSHPLSSTSKHGAFILLVEDNHAVRELLQQSLKEDGFEVIAAEDGRAALAHAQRQARRFDLVVTDVLMPGMGGRELAERLAELQPGLRVLFMSAYAADDLSRLRILEGVSLLQKPFSGSALVRKVREVLQDARAA